MNRGSLDQKKINAESIRPHLGLECGSPLHFQVLKTGLKLLQNWSKNPLDRIEKGGRILSCVQDRFERAADFEKRA